MKHSPLRVTLSLAFCLVMTSCLCSDEVLSEAVSPDGGLTATCYARDCGATTAYVTNVSLHLSSEGYKNADTIVFGVKGRVKLILTWKGPHALEIVCSNCTRQDIEIQDVAVGPIDISYRLAQAGRAGEQ